MNWLGKAPRDPLLDSVQTAYKVAILYDGEPLYEIRYGTSAAQVSDEFERDLKEAEESGNWWAWKGEGDSVRKLRASFISGFEVRPAGGRGSWSG